MMASNAVEQAKASGVTDAAQLDALSAAAYPHFLHVMAILFVFNVIIMLIIGRLYPRDTDFILPYTKQVDITPYKYVRQVGIAVCIIVVAIYVYFA